MKKTLLIILLVLLCLALLFLLLRGIQAFLFRRIVKEFIPQDWSVHLPNGYEIWRINSQDIVLVKVSPSGGSDTVVSAHINAYWHNERYIGLWCAKDGADDLLGVAPEQDHYYLIDTQTDSVWGLLTPDEFETLCREYAPSGFDVWTKTSSVPAEITTYP